MNRRRTLPLGIDVGSTRVCIACTEEDLYGNRRLGAVVTQPFPRDIDREVAAAGALRDAVRMLGTRERRCVAALQAPEARVLPRSFPKMSTRERRSCARFEAEHAHDRTSGGERAVARIHAVDRATALYAFGSALPSALDRVRRIVASARLRLVGVDLDAFALRRALPGSDVVVDLGLHRTSVHAMTSAVAGSTYLRLGGSSITRAIAAELALDEDVAEERKVRFGAAGAAATARRELVASIAAAVARLRDGAALRTLAMIGNGSRLPGLVREVERETGAAAPAESLRCAFPSDAFPDDVLTAAFPDCALAVGLSCWSFGA